MGVLDNEYAVMENAPSTFRDVAERKLADAQAALDTAQLQYQNDQQAIADLQRNLDIANHSLGLDADTIELQAKQIQQAQMQLASALAPLGDIYIGRDLQKMNDPVTGWQPPQVSGAIGGNAPAVDLRTWDANGNLVLLTTGKPGEYDDWLTALHIPNVFKATSRVGMTGWGFTLDSKQSFVQCHENDSIYTGVTGMFNGSLQCNFSTGQLQIERGPDPVTGKGSWMDAGVPVPRLSAGHHTLEALYIFDQAAKTIQYAMLAVDGVRTLIPASVGVRKAFAPSWTPGKLHLQAQEDANSQGGTFQTVYDSIWAVIL